MVAPRGDTIAAVATATGRAALAVVRVSGPAARAIAARLGVPLGAAPRRATRVQLHACDAPGEPLDDALHTFFPAPHSPTGEDVVELSVHGGHQVPAAVLAALVAAGARPALPGEFTERAVRAGKLDLLQAEAIADLIGARSRATHRAALHQLSGALSHRLAALRDAVLDLEALIAYEIDFPTEDDGPLPRARATNAAAAVLASLRALTDTLPAATLGRDGAMVVLAGAPNAGKSSLFNALLGEARAIVSAEPGTTRDAIEVLVDDDPWPLRLVDTAGLRDEAADVVERLGIEVSERQLGLAHLVLACGEDAASVHAASVAIARATNAPMIGVLTKGDLHAGADDVGAPSPPEPSIVRVSARTGEGLAALRSAIRAAIGAAHPPPDDAPVVTRARHAAALSTAAAEVELFRTAWSSGALPATVAATHLRAAVHALDGLLGAVDPDDVLARVFREFCIGK